MGQRSIQSIAIEKSSSIISALQQMDAQKTKLLLVLDNERFCSLLSIGDIQRAIISNVSLETPVSHILRKQVNVAKTSESREDIQGDTGQVSI